MRAELEDIDSILNHFKEEAKNSESYMGFMENGESAYATLFMYGWIEASIKILLQDAYNGIKTIEEVKKELGL